MFTAPLATQEVRCPSKWQSAWIIVTPDSVTEGLTGLSGLMKIEIISGQHHYRFTYRLPNQQKFLGSSFQE